MAYFLTVLVRPSKKAVLFIIASLVISAGLFCVPAAEAAQIDPRSLRISNSTAGAGGVTYRFEIGIATSGDIGSMRFQFCSNTSLIDDVCDPPFGLDALNANLSEQTGGGGGYSLHPMTGSSEIILTRVPGNVASGLAVFTFTNLRNPVAIGTTFVRVYTHASVDGTGPYTDAGGLAFATSGDVSVSAEVPPFLLFCAGVQIDGYDCASANGDLINFGELGADRTGAGVSQMLAATNADSGYGIRVSGTTLASGNNIIEPMSGQFSRAGSSQFGMNLRHNFAPDVGRDAEGPGAGWPAGGQNGEGYDAPNRYRFKAGEVVAVVNEPDDFRKYTVSYVVNVPRGQPGGVYAATMTYICLANF